MNCSQDVVQFAEKEEAFWRQKASKFLMEGDHNTTYYQNIANHSKVSRHIHKITSYNSNVIKNLDLISASGIDYFTKAFISNFIPDLNTDFSFMHSIITEEDNLLLTNIPSEEEIWCILKNMNSDSIAGPNG
ncbi:hypothetical protein KFK09_014918 [Dendrobium nobile]|uniref:Uncharacterized protein n=1 Tax=Dendrobium nobile TaxID=94219 RepID=A0A8T3B4H3_DENNO|nr:hypothetical protein KFK09_014918 [Dendrobium nobile]